MSEVYMNNMLAILIGIGLRLVVPIAITVLIVYFLHRLDLRWQADALQLQTAATEKAECWKIKGCPPEQYSDCAAYTSEQPCWQVHRLYNGYLREECLTCDVFMNAPIPAHTP
jgi:hypothetical protein